MKYDVITFGSGTRDVYVLCKDFLVVEQKKFITGKGLEMSLGSKIEVDDILFRTGGGATNAAATFAAQGLKVSWCGMVGEDPGGQEIIKKLKGLGVHTGFILTTKEKYTNYSVILCPAKQDRTILVYHGASSELTKKDIPWKKLRARWLYLAPLSGKLAKLFPYLVDFAYKNNIKIAANPGNSQLKLPKKILKRALSKVNILLLNQEEAKILTGLRKASDEKLIKTLRNLTKGIIVLTKGPGGAVASDGKFIYKTPILKTKVLDRTGAGDAFGSAFVTEYSKTGNVVSALQFGIANSSACISKWGAKEGVLKTGQPYKKVPVRRNVLK